MASTLSPRTSLKNGRPILAHYKAEDCATAVTASGRSTPGYASLLEVSHLRKSFGNTVAVDDLSFHVEAGEIFGLLGPNGAGKSTTMTIIAGHRRADSGTVTIAGQPAGLQQRTVQRMLGVVPQNLAIYDDLTARENIKFFGDLYGVRGAELKRRIERVLDLIGLQSHADQFVRTFSGGMKRRLNFGVALIHEPRLVILDEPTVGIDPQSRSHILECIRQLAAEGVGVIYASHYMEEVEAICRRVAIIDHGKLLALGTLEELIDQSNGDLSVRIAAPVGDLRVRLSGLADIVASDEDEPRVVIRRERNATTGAVTRRLTSVMEILSARGVDVISIDTHKQNLESLFLEMTGRKLRD
jgi:ABC-2 type transport system ATP-binding protein